MPVCNGYTCVYWHDVCTPNVGCADVRELQTVLIKFCTSNYLVVYVSICQTILAHHKTYHSNSLRQKPTRYRLWITCVFIIMDCSLVWVQTYLPCINSNARMFSQVFHIWKQTQWQKFGSLSVLLAHFSLQNVPLRTQCDCIFPLNMIASLTYCMVTFHISYSHWLILLMLVWGSMYVRTHTDPLSRFSVSMLWFLSRYESHGKWLESVP